MDVDDGGGGFPFCKIALCRGHGCGASDEELPAGKGSGFFHQEGVHQKPGFSQLTIEAKDERDGDRSVELGIGIPT